nr:MAG TPA: hypothetical protein [Caudoviricetes sp.]
MYSLNLFLIFSLIFSYQIQSFSQFFIIFRISFFVVLFISRANFFILSQINFFILLKSKSYFPTSEIAICHSFFNIFT